MKYNAKQTAINFALYNKCHMDNNTGGGKHDTSIIDYVIDQMWHKQCSET